MHDQTGRTFATYLDAQERARLDARAATAEQERDDALDDLTQAWAALNRAHVADPAASVGQLIDRLAAQRDQARAEVERVTAQRDTLRVTADEMTRAVKRLVPERDTARRLAAMYERELGYADAERQEAEAQRDAMRRVVDAARALVDAIDDGAETGEAHRALGEALAAVEADTPAVSLGSPVARAQEPQTWCVCGAPHTGPCPRCVPVPAATPGQGEPDETQETTQRIPAHGPGSLPHGYMRGCGDRCNNLQCPAGLTHDRCTKACLPAAVLAAAVDTLTGDRP